MKHTTVILILFLCLVSCKEIGNSFINPHTVKKCINNKLEKDIDVYKEFKNIENVLIKTKLLDKVSKKSYIKIFNELNSSSDNSLFLINLNKFHTIINSTIKNRNILIFTPTMINLFECNKDYLDKLEGIEKSKYSNYQVILDKLLRQGDFDNFDTIKKLISSIPEKDFLNIYFRVPLISLYSLMSEYYKNSDAVDMNIQE